MHGGWHLAQMFPADDPNKSFGSFLWDAYAPLVLGLVVVLVLALVLVRLTSKGKGKGAGATPKAPIPDWYPDPWDPQWERWWNGARWTGDVRRAPWPGPVHQGPTSTSGPSWPPT